MPNAWVTPFASKIFAGYDWPSPYLINPGNGKLYKFGPQRYEHAVAPTAGNPLGISGPLDPVTGTTASAYTRTKVRERSGAASLASEIWGGRISTMFGFRTDRADRIDYRNLTVKGPITYNSTTLGAVFDTPVRGLRGYAAYATNGNPNFDAGLDIFNQALPTGRGVGKEAGLKFSMWEHRLSGNITYYVSEGQNFVASLGALRDDVDPDGINGRYGGDGYVFSRKSDGLSVRLTARPLKSWQVTLNYAEANGSERKNVALPIFYNDEFNTTTVNGVQVVGVRSGTTVTPLMVPSVPGNTTSPQTTLSLAMMKDRASPYFAVLDPESGRILNAAALRLTTPGVGTGRNGVSVTEHQLGFVPPSPTITVRRAGERTAGYAEHSFSLINRYQFSEGRLRGLVVGMTNVYHQGFRAYMYTDTLNGGVRKMLYYPDIFENSVFSLYRFKPTQRIHTHVRVSVSNLLDKQAVVTLPSSTTGRINAFTYQYTPRRFIVSTGFEF
jgi:outer membrane receptor protein involved in Fe transport